MDRETFLMGMKNIDLCHPYAKKFRNTYLSYIEKEKISKQNVGQAGRRISAKQKLHRFPTGFVKRTKLCE